MPLLTAERLLAAVEPLSHPHRLREVARTAAGLAPAELSSLIAELDGRGPYERRLAALAALAGRQTGHLTARIEDPDPTVRRYAHRAIRKLPVPAEALESALLTAAKAVRDEVARAVLRSGRTPLADRLVPMLRERRGAAEAARLLPLCSARVVAAELPLLAHAITFSTSLGHRHPGAVLDEAERRLADLPYGLRPAFWVRHANGLAAAAHHEPARALDLLERHPVRGTFPGPLRDRLPGLAAVSTEAAERTVRLLLATERNRHNPPLRTDLARRLVAARPAGDGLAALAHRDSRDHLTLIRQLPPERRAAFYDEVAARPTLYQQWYSVEVLAELPAEERWVRARARLAEDKEDLDPLTVLPVAEARPGLLAETRTADAVDRAWAWGRLVLQAGRCGEPGALPEVLDLLGQLRNERDPVRQDALKEVAALPPGLLDEAAAAPLERLTEDALTARDCSPATRAALVRLAGAVLGEHAGGPARALVAWAVRTVERVAGQPGGTGPAVGLALARGSEAAAVAELRAALERSARSEDAALLLTVAEALGPRARRAPLLADLLERVVRTGNDRATERAFALLRPARVVPLLALRPSAVALAPVRAVLTRVRTDLLGPLLATPLTAADLAHADHWTPAQQRTAAGQLARTVDDSDRAPQERAAALSAAARIPVHGEELLRRYAGSAETLLAEAALAALPWTERPAAALPVLFSHAGDDRARVALYAAGRAARYARDAELHPELRRIALAPGAKVTSRKQAVRLAAEHLGPAEAQALLREAYTAPGQHPDVRAAVVAVVGERIADLPLWDVLTDAAEEGHGLRETLAQHLRAQAVPAEQRPVLAGLMARLATDESYSVASTARTQLVAWAGHVPEAVLALVPLVTGLAERESGDRAVQVIDGVAVSDAPHPLGGWAPGSVLAETLTALIATVRAGEPELPGRDLPARRRIAALTGWLGSGDAPAETVRAARRGVAAMLLTEPRLLAEATRQLVEALDFDAPDLGEHLAELAAMVAGRPALAAATAELLGRYAWQPRKAPEYLLAAARRLAAIDGLAPGLFAVALTTFAPRFDWPPAWRDLLHALRRHPDPDVRDAALAVSAESD